MSYDDDEKCWRDDTLLLTRYATKYLSPQTHATDICVSYTHIYIEKNSPPIRHRFLQKSQE